MKLTEADRRKLAPLLDELARGVEEVLLTGLTTASEATRRTLGVAFQEASRMRLLRLGSTLRAANDELGRFTRNEPEFSRRRLCFFLNRAWLLSHGLARAIRAQDQEQFERLLWTPTNQPVERLDVVTLGVVKKVVTGSFCAFDFRLRTTEPAGQIPAGCRLAWSCIFPLQPGVEVPAEAYLHLPQQQKFNASAFLEGRTVRLGQIGVALDGFGGGRVALGEHSTVVAAEPFSAWDSFQSWDPRNALERIESHEPSPFDLDVEMQEEVVLHDWQLGEPAEGESERQMARPITCGATAFAAVVSAGDEGESLGKALESLRQQEPPPPLFGLMHYEKCRLMLQPLAVFGAKGPQYLTISGEKVDRAKLLRALWKPK